MFKESASGTWPLPEHWGTDEILARRAGFTRHGNFLLDRRDDGLCSDACGTRCSGVYDEVGDTSQEHHVASIVDVDEGPLRA